jgi:hypothetical protein
MGIRDVTYNDIHGEKPTISFYQSEIELEKLVSSFVGRAIAEGLGAEDVVVLTCSTLENSWLDIGHLYGGMSMSLEREPGKILFTTIRKYKGLEAEAVLIVDAQLSSLTRPESRRLLYVGSSRAKSLLGIAMLEDVERQDFGDLLHTIAPDRNVPRNKKGLKRLFQMADAR